MSSTPLRNVTIVGASGRLGPFILSAVSESPANHNITVVTRKESSATFPAGTRVVRVGNDYPSAEMEGIFRDQDAVILCLGFAGEQHHSALVRAAIAAGVKRVVVSGYGCYEENKLVRQVFPVAATKAKMLEEMRELEQQTRKEGKDWSWTNIRCGLFFDFCVKMGFFGIDPEKHTATIWDDGKQLFSATTLRSIGVSVAGVLANPEATANRSVYVSSLETCMNEVLAAEQKATNTKPQDWTVNHVNTDEQIAKFTKQMKEATELLPRMIAMGKLALATHVKPEFEQNFQALGLLDNELLGVQRENVDEAVRKVIEAGVSSYY